MLVSLEGQLTERASMEASQPPQTTLVIDRFINVWPRESCGDNLGDTGLRGTYWKLVRLGDEPVAAFSNQREAHLVFATDELRVAGSGGCNRVFGSFELDGDRLQFGHMASTQMACIDGMEQESRLFKMLEHVERYRIQGGYLELLDAGGTVSARFQAVALP